MYKKGGGTTRKLRQANIIYSSLSTRLSKSHLLFAFDPEVVIIAFECALKKQRKKKNNDTKSKRYRYVRGLDVEKIINLSLAVKRSCH